MLISLSYYKIRIDAVIHDGKRSSNDMYKWDNAGDIASMSNSLSLISSSSPAIVSGSIEYLNIVLPNTGASEPDSDRYCWQGDIDWYEFMVNEAGVYVIRTYGNNGLYGVLYEGKTFMQSSSGVYMQVALSPGKLYKLKILGVSSGNNGDYTLSIVKS